MRDNPFSEIINDLVEIADELARRQDVDNEIKYRLHIFNVFTHDLCDVINKIIDNIKLFRQVIVNMSLHPLVNKKEFFDTYQYTSKFEKLIISDCIVTTFTVFMNLLHALGLSVILDEDDRIYYKVKRISERLNRLIS